MIETRDDILPARGLLPRLRAASMSETAEQTGDPSVDRSEATRRAFLAAAGATLATSGFATAQARSRFLLLTGAAGGVFHDYGPLLARLAAREAPVDLDVQPSGGSNDNIRAVGRGEADLGLINMGPAYDAWEGRAPFAAGGPHRNLRALFPMYETPFSLLALRASGIASLSGLAGRTVGVGPAGGPGEVFFKGLAKERGLAVKLATGSPNELGRRILAGEIDAFWFGAGLPVGVFADVLEKADALVFGLDAAEVAAFRRAFAYVAPYAIPAGTYKGQAAALTTGAIWNFVVASDRMPDDAAYGLTRVALENTAALTAELPAAAGTATGNVLANTFLPLHPGAARYYREKGIVLPAVLTAI